MSDTCSYCLEDTATAVDLDGDAICDDCSLPIPENCAACGKPAEGFAMVGELRYCHPDDGPSCYMGENR